MVDTLTDFLKGFDLQVVGGKNIQVPTPGVNAATIQEEQAVVTQLKSKTSHVYGTKEQSNRDFIASLGSLIVLRLILPYKRDDGAPHEVLGTLTPDTNFVRGSLRFAFLGRLSQEGLYVPPQYMPRTGLGLTQDQRLYLSAANQLSTVGEHDMSQKVPIVDPRHLLNAMAEFNTGSFAASQVQRANPALRSHIGDTWERERGMLPIISSQDRERPANDLVWAPITFSPLYNIRQALPFAVRFTRELLDQTELARKRLVPLRANEKGALERIQEMGFATLLMKNTTSHLARKVEHKLT